ncbi:hypothetical protein, partial [Burkholderia multivorans]|uniref:hypothetical protein n=1 Tax=Burkholderia multivorans TaxID=87883 RepID=UPI003B75B8A1
MGAGRGSRPAGRHQHKKRTTMKKQKTIGTASKMLLAWGLPALAGVSLTGVARADDAAPAPLTV